MPVTNVLLIAFIGIAAIALLIQMLVFAGISRKLGQLHDQIEPLMPPMIKTAQALVPLMEEAQKIVAEARPKIQIFTTNLAEISTTVSGGVKRADAFATQMGERVELQMVRLDEALGTAMANLEEITSTVRDTVLRPIRDIHALVAGLRTGMDFFLRRRASPPRKPNYQDEEMFI